MKKTLSVLNAFVILFLCILLMACPEKAPTSKNVTSINGDVVYVYNHDGSKLEGVYKEGYTPSGITVAINNDSLRVGDQFEGRIYVLNPIHKIDIIEPTKQIYTNSDPDDNRFKYYRFKPERAGEYTFTGTISYDSVSFDFQYAFYVKGMEE